MIRRALIACLGLVAMGTLVLVAQRARAPEFRHEEHTKLFPGSCLTCHVGATDTTQSVWPSAVSCDACHDGDVQPKVAWAAPTQPRASNLRFEHVAHITATADSVGCVACHTTGDLKGEVHVSEAAQCVSCHKPGLDHLEVGDRECATCHVALAEATLLAASDVAKFPVPASHQAPDFGLSGHGTAAGDGEVANTACATCHAQNFCLNCHVNAPEVPAIQALALDDRSLVHGFNRVAPASHATQRFALDHRREADRDLRSCATCHDQQSCAACHVAPLPKSVRAMPTPAPDRAVSVAVERQTPGSHTIAFREGHGSEASATPRACSTCHVRQDCLNCHRPDPASGPGQGGGGYHPADYVVRHPSSAYSRQVTCSDCHNTQQFCASCHQQAGLGGGNTIGGGTYHDGKAAFFVGHGQAARQSLESCVSCHAERDCTVCHSAQGGRRFSPHGPGFDGERLRKRNPEMCIACHGRAIPTSNR